MAMAERTGKSVTCGDVIYEFATEEAAIGFESCCNGGGKPGACAEQWPPVGKRKKIKNERGTGIGE